MSSELQTEKDVNLDMADLNINKDHETTEASNVNTSQKSIRPQWQ
jgi:hypothetical protein